HNHIVINSVNFETGKKYQAHGKEAIERARSLSDEVCKSHDLSVVKEHNASVRHTLAEQHLLEKNKISWKDELREAIEYARDNSTNFDSFKRHLNDVYGVETKLRGKPLALNIQSVNALYEPINWVLIMKGRGWNMSLQDKLNENRNMSELFQETKELNELMKSYIRVHMNEEMAKEVTIHNQLNQIQEKSDKVMSNMQSILNTQGKMLEENAENLQAILINGHEEMEKSNNKTVKAVQEMQKSNVEELNQINNEI